jgi:hypothetical protein
MIELQAKKLYWHYAADPPRDLCAHGAVFLKIGDKIVSDGVDVEWTLSTAAYYLLKTLNEDHYATKESYDFLIPHCGHTMWAVGDANDELVLQGCDIGIDWTISRKGNTVVHTFSESEIIETTFDEWRDVVCQFSDEVWSFYESSEPKIVEDKDDRAGFELFLSEWKRLRLEAFE